MDFFSREREGVDRVDVVTMGLKKTGDTFSRSVVR
jgi:hypothetical protein